jgi:hypothetical protein
MLAVRNRNRGVKPPTVYGGVMPAWSVPSNTYIGELLDERLDVEARALGSSSASSMGTVAASSRADTLASAAKVGR